LAFLATFDTRCASTATHPARAFRTAHHSGIFRKALPGAARVRRRQPPACRVGRLPGLLGDADRPQTLARRPSTLRRRITAPDSYFRFSRTRALSRDSRPNPPIPIPRVPFREPALSVFYSGLNDAFSRSSSRASKFQLGRAIGKRPLVVVPYHDRLFGTRRRSHAHDNPRN
jgi:hypothetical protein